MSLEATSRELRAIIRTTVEVVGAFAPADLRYQLRSNTRPDNMLMLIIKLELDGAFARQLANQKWPLLRCLELGSSALDVTQVAHLAEGQWPDLRSLEMNASRLGMAALQLLAKADWPKLERLKLDGETGQPKDAVSAAQGIMIDKHSQQCLLQGKWPELRLLHINISDADALHFAPCNWPKLVALKVVANKLHPEVLVRLAYGHWSCLRSLAIGLDSVAIRQLAQATWPKLVSLTLDGSPLGGQALQPICKANWSQLRCVSLADSSLDNAGIECIAQAQWPLLTELHLAGNQLDIIAVKHMVSAERPLLQKLDLGSCGLSADTIQELVCGSWPAMRRLEVDNNELTAEAVVHLSKGVWPQLRYLDMRNSQLRGSTAMSHFVEAGWPLLQHLLLAFTHMDNLAISHLAQGSWLKLQTLTVDIAQATDMWSDDMFEILCKGRWPQLSKLVLNRVTLNLTPFAIQHIVKGCWPKMPDEVLAPEFQWHEVCSH